MTGDVVSWFHRYNSHAIPFGDSSGSGICDRIGRTKGGEPDKGEDVLRELPLKFFDPLLRFSVPKVDVEGRHPFVGAEPDRA